MKRLLLALLLLCVSLFVGCGGSSSSSGGGGNTTVTLVSIAVTPASPSINVGATQQFSATGTYSDGSTKVLTSSANWLSVTSSVATVNTSGLVTAVAVGTSSITASSSGIVGSTTLTVVNPLVSIAVTPPTVTLAPVAQQQFTATGTYSDGTKQTITSTVTWASSAPSVAAINPAGLAVAVAPGTTTISATLGSVSGTATLTVGNPLVSIAVTPATASVAPNGTQQFTATGTFADQSTKVLTSGVIWKASAGATITSGGLATGVTPNTTSTITATSGTISGTATLTVTNPLVSIAVAPPTASVAPNGTQQFTATGTYADHSTQNITSSVTWSASVGATITAGGLATGVTPNTTSTIMAAQGNISGTAILTITNPLVSIAVTPATASIAVTFTQQFTAIGTYADHTTSNITSAVTWGSSVPAVATISTLGLATGLTPGTTSITATSGAITSPSATLTVTNATLQSIAVTPVSIAIPLANQQQFTAIGTFSDQSTQDITRSVTWTSSDTTKVAINNNPNVAPVGLATGVAVTTSAVTITATKSPGTPGTASVTVNAANLVSIAITPSTTNLAEGTSRQYTAIGTFNNGSTLNITSQATWSSSDTTNATVNSGLVKALTGNCPTSCPVAITAALGSVSQSLTVDVNNVTVNSITVTPIAATIPVGVTQRFNAVATFSDQSTQDITSNALWNSSNPGVATVNSVGIATSVGMGSTSITATFGGVSGSAQLTVNSVTLTKITITPSQTTFLALGSTVSFQATGTYSDQSAQNLGNLPSWTSSVPSAVTIGLHTGVATGVSTGSSNITATYQNVTSNVTQINVNPALVSIAITPPIGSVPFGVELPFTAIGTFQNGNTANLTANVTWASSLSSIATISNATGQQGLATGVSTGQTSITAVFAGVVGNAKLNVTDATIQSIAITPNNSHAPVGTQVSFSAKGTFIDSNQNTSVVDLSAQVTWASSVATVATINPSGLANTAGTGVTSISATFTQNGVTVMGATNLTVP